MCEADHYMKRSKSRPTQLRLGRVVATGGALEVLMDAGESPAKYLDRHSACDWGVVDAEDWRANDNAVAMGSRVLSAYMIGSRKLWIITEADRSATTLLLPEEY